AAGGQQAGTGGERDGPGGGGPGAALARGARKGSGQAGHVRCHADVTPVLPCRFPWLSHDLATVLARVDGPRTPAGLAAASAWGAAPPALSVSGGAQLVVALSGGSSRSMQTRAAELPPWSLLRAASPGVTSLSASS